MFNHPLFIKSSIFENDFSELLRKTKNYIGSFLVINDYLIPFMKLPFIEKRNATLDLSEPGQVSGILSKDPLYPSQLHIIP